MASRKGFHRFHYHQNCRLLHTRYQNIHLRKYVQDSVNLILKGYWNFLNPLHFWTPFLDTGFNPFRSIFMSIVFNISIIRLYQCFTCIRIFLLHISQFSSSRRWRSKEEISDVDFDFYATTGRDAPLPDC